MTEINEDGFTKEDVEAALRLLSRLKDRAKTNGEETQVLGISTTEYYLQNYQAQSNWRDELPSDRADAENNLTLTECVGDDGGG